MQILTGCSIIAIVIYLDHNATTPVDIEVRDAVSLSLEVFGNPSSSHALGRKAKSLVENSRAQVAGLIGCLPDEIFFTSGGTESNNLAVLGTARLRGKGHIITSVIEHPSVLNPIKYLESTGFKVTYVGVDSDCRVSAEDVANSITKDTVLVSVMHSNNETGTLQPVEEIREICTQRGVTFHSDTAQSIGKMPVNAFADMITVVSHKFYGPKGIGAIYVKKRLKLSPILFGAGHERGMRPGTENVPGIAGLGKACEIAGRDIAERAAKSNALRGLLYEELERRIKGIRLNGHKTLCLPNTLNVSVPGVDAAETVDSLKDLLAISTGSACHAGIKKPSPVLKAMGLGDDEALSSFRFSTGKDNTEEEVREAAKRFSTALRR